MRSPARDRVAVRCRRIGRAALLAITLVAARPVAAAALTLPPGFVAEALPWTFDLPTCLAFLPDGRLLVGEKGGIVYLVSGNQRWPLWVREEEVLNTDDRGLIGIAVDPGFTTNRRLYFFYTVDPDSDGIELDHYDDCFARLAGYEFDPAGAPHVDPATRRILLGVDWSHGFPDGSGTHTAGALAWGRDGTLLVSAGDGAHFEVMDAGGLDPDLFLPGRADPAEDIGAFRAQRLASLDGKILRIDPATGLGLPSNPYWDGDPGSTRSRVWCYGLRNPFRITVRPGTGSTDPAAGSPGTLYFGDVGWNTWEELDVARVPGGNYGWPCFEAFAAADSYPAATPANSGCGTLGAPQNPGPLTLPVVAFHHTDPSQSVPPGLSGDCLVSGVFYTGALYPGSFAGRIVLGDYGEDWIATLAVDDRDTPVDLDGFAVDAGGPVAFATDPRTGDVWYAAIRTGLVQHLRYAVPSAVAPPADAAPAISEAWPDPSRGAVRFRISLTASGPLRLEVFDALGRRVWETVEADRPSGATMLAWDGRRADGGPVGPGLYLARVTTPGGRAVRRFVVLR